MKTVNTAFRHLHNYDEFEVILEKRRRLKRLKSNLYIPNVTSGNSDGWKTQFQTRNFVQQSMLCIILLKTASCILYLAAYLSSYHEKVIKAP